MKLRVSLLLCTVVAIAQAAVPLPKDVIGFAPGEEKKLANYEEIVSYFESLPKASDRIRLERFGTTSSGKPMIMAFISDPENLKKLAHYRDISRKLALGLPDPQEAEKMAAEGKAIVWIDSGLHASEVAPSQHAPELAYRMLIGESEEMKRIRKQVILIQVPCINPDGLDMVVDWYRHNVGTPYETAPLPNLYQKYSGHDNNRDWYMMNLPETRYVTRQLFQEWFPQIIYNQHQAPPFPARIFVPPYAEPLNPNIPAAVMEGINLIGAAMKERFARADQPGVLSYWGFDAWWNGGLRSVPAFHNMHGILTETAGFALGNSKVYRAADFPERFGNGIPTKEPTVFYERPWMGGKWGVREAIDYMLTADMAILELASARSSYYLSKAYAMARINMDSAAAPYAYVMRNDEGDASSTREMLLRLQMAGINVQRAALAFKANGKTYPEGSFVVRTAQAFRGYLIDLMEPQVYPELKTGTTGPTKRPYDVAGWTLPMQMGVNVDRIDQSFEAKVENAELRPMEPSRDHRDIGFFLTMADLTGRAAKVRWSANGDLLTASDGAFQTGAYEMSKPRVGVYEAWPVGNDSGWTEWMLDTFRVPHTVLHNEDVRAGGLRARFDTIILPSQSSDSILHGTRSGERPTTRSTPGDDSPAQQRPEFAGGIELAGASELDRFVREGGTLLAFDQASEVPVTQFPLPLRLLVRPQPEGRDAETAPGYYCPGSILRITVDNTNPIAFGMAQNAFAFSSGGQAYDVTLLPEFNSGDREVHTIASYARSNLLASGWISGARTVLGKPILVEARHGRGRVILFGFRPQHRGQTFGTFKFVLNAIYLASSKKI